LWRQWFRRENFLPAQRFSRPDYSWTPTDALLERGRLTGEEHHASYAERNVAQKKRNFGPTNP